MRYMLYIVILLFLNACHHTQTQQSSTASTENISTNNTNPQKDIPSYTTKNWYIYFQATDNTHNLKSSYMQIGQLDQNSTFKYNLKAIKPFENNFIDITYQTSTGNYKSVFHPFNLDEDTWYFTINSSDQNANITLSWIGLYEVKPYIKNNQTQYRISRKLNKEILNAITVIDLTTNQEIPLIKANNLLSYTFSMNNQTKRVFKVYLSSKQTLYNKNLSTQFKISKPLNPTTIINTKNIDFDISKPPMFK